MNTMKILLGATIVLLVAGLIVSWNAKNEGVAQASPEDLARYEKVLAEMRKETERLNGSPVQSAQVPAAGAVASSPADFPAEDSRIAELEARLLEMEREKRELADEKERAERDATVARDEAGLAGQRQIESHDRQQHRARQISQALLVARVKEFIEDEFGGFVVLHVERPDNASSGAILGIRRNTGIIGKVRVTENTPEGAIASPLPESCLGGPVDIREGDELIVEPQF